MTDEEEMGKRLFDKLTENLHQIYTDEGLEGVEKVRAEYVASLKNARLSLESILRSVGSETRKKETIDILAKIDDVLIEEAQKRTPEP